MSESIKSLEDIRGGEPDNFRGLEGVQVLIENGELCAEINRTLQEVRTMLRSEAIEENDARQMVKKLMEMVRAVPEAAAAPMIDAIFCLASKSGIDVPLPMTGGNHAWPPMPTGSR